MMQGQEDTAWVERWSRREFLQISCCAAALAGAGEGWPATGEAAGLSEAGSVPATMAQPRDVTLFLCGDVMTGRGIDQVLPHPSEPVIHERYMASAQGYVELAERTNGPIPRPVDFSYIWGDVLGELEARLPDLRIINLETSITTSNKYEPKGINYRMHPRNIPCLPAAGIDCCVLANNHVLDWGVPGLIETLATLRQAGIAVAGAGNNAAEAMRPASLHVRGKGRVLVFGFGIPTSGVPATWAATPERAGVSFLPDLSPHTADRAATEMRRQRRPGDLAVASIHWGGNWGYDVPQEQRDFAHRLIDAGAADVVHGHSSHHCKGIEVYQGRPILYGCGDFINDYEGISGYEEFRSDLVLAYFVTLDAATGHMKQLAMVPYRLRRFRLGRTTKEETAWLQRTMDREGKKLGATVELTKEEKLALRW